MEQYELDTFGRSHDIMSNFWNSCFDDLMSTAFKREKDRSDSKSKFQVLCVYTLMQKYSTALKKFFFTTITNVNFFVCLLVCFSGGLQDQRQIQRNAKLCFHFLIIL